mmetsp:Transcript_3456/g.9011  ORF Transcript_3456/g.9011 Transcript_3456/m.9011 type:complete len:273 (-) Transcript_3456:1112-1930(-)
MHASNVALPRRPRSAAKFRLKLRPSSTAMYSWLIQVSTDSSLGQSKSSWNRATRWWSSSCGSRRTCAAAAKVCPAAAAARSASISRFTAYVSSAVLMCSVPVTGARSGSARRASSRDMSRAMPSRSSERWSSFSQCLRTAGTECGLRSGGAPGGRKCCPWPNTASQHWLTNSSIWGTAPVTRARFATVPGRCVALFSSSAMQASCTISTSMSCGSRPTSRSLSRLRLRSRRMRSEVLRGSRAPGVLLLGAQFEALLRPSLSSRSRQRICCSA